MVFLEVATTSDALLGMALVGGALASEDIKAGLRVSFTDSSVSEERKKYEDNKYMKVADNDQPL